jgi:hypothetical protein
MAATKCAEDGLAEELTPERALAVIADALGRGGLGQHVVVHAAGEKPYKGIGDKPYVTWMTRVVFVGQTEADVHMSIIDDFKDEVFLSQIYLALLPQEKCTDGEIANISIAYAPEGPVGTQATIAAVDALMTALPGRVVVVYNEKHGDAPFDKGSVVDTYVLRVPSTTNDLWIKDRIKEKGSSKKHPKCRAYVSHVKDFLDSAFAAELRITIA